MKKALIIITILLVLTAIPVTIFLVKQQQDIRQRAAPATDMYFEPNQTAANVGQTFTLDVKMNTGQNYVAAAQVDITVDPLYLEIVSLQQSGTFLPRVLQDPLVTGGAASIALGYQSGEGLPGGANGQAQKIAVLTLRALTPTTESVKVRFASTSRVSGGTLTPGDITDPDKGQNVLISTSESQITITSGAGGSPQPSATPGTGATPTPAATPRPSPSATPGTGGGTASPTPRPSPSSSPSTKKTAITTPANGSTTTNSRPTISGTSFANAVVILSVNSGQTNVITTTINANTQGAWSYTPTNNLANGSYSITVTATDSATNIEEVATSTFTVAASGGSGTGTATPTPSASAATASTNPDDSGMPVTGTATPTFFLLGLAVILLTFGTGAAFLFK